jgi:hypothetical protein
LSPRPLFSQKGRRNLALFLILVVVGLLVYGAVNPPDPADLLNKILDAEARFEAQTHASWPEGTNQVVLVMVFVIVLLGEPIADLVRFVIRLIERCLGMDSELHVDTRSVTVIGKAVVLALTWTLSVAVVNLS